MQKFRLPSRSPDFMSYPSPSLIDRAGTRTEDPFGSPGATTPHYSDTLSDPQLPSLQAPFGATSTSPQAEMHMNGSSDLPSRLQPERSPELSLNLPSTRENGQGPNPFSHSQVTKRTSLRRTRKPHVDRRSKRTRRGRRDCKNDVEERRVRRRPKGESTKPVSSAEKRETHRHAEKFEEPTSEKAKSKPRTLLRATTRPRTRLSSAAEGTDAKLLEPAKILGVRAAASGNALEYAVEWNANGEAGLVRACCSSEDLAKRWPKFLIDYLEHHVILVKNGLAGPPC